MTEGSNDTTPQDYVYCGTTVDDFHTAYNRAHGYVALLVCVLGCIANSLNIIVLTRREMRSPTNAILTGLAIADLAVMIDYIPYACHEFILPQAQYSREKQFAYSWTWFVKFHSIFAQICHTISIWLTVTLAVWRYIAISYPQKNRIWCGMRTTIITIMTSCIVCPLIVIPPLHLAFSIEPKTEWLDSHGQKTKVIGTPSSPSQSSSSSSSSSASASSSSSSLSSTSSLSSSALAATAAAAAAAIEAASTVGGVGGALESTTSTGIAIGIGIGIANNITSTAATINEIRNVTVYKIVMSQLALDHPALLNSNFWIYSVLIKLIPCFALTILSIRLIAALMEAKRRRKQLTCNTATSASAGNGMKQIINGKAVERPRKNSKTLEKEKQTDRTTRMLLAVLLLFLLTEFPQGILGLLSGLLGTKFFQQCYLKFGDLMDILALINSGINFILYCSMSRQFRSTFTLLFRPKFFDKWMAIPQDDNNQYNRVENTRENNFLTTQVTQV